MSRFLTQRDLVEMIYQKSGFRMGYDRISQICSGRKKNYSLETAVMIAEALEVSIDEIIEIRNVKKNNLVNVKDTPNT